MSAIYESEHYKSKLDTPTNVRHRRKIDELFQRIRDAKQHGDYVIEFRVADGSIQGVSFAEKKCGRLVQMPDFSLGFGDLNSTYDRVLVTGWHGQVSVETNSAYNQGRDLFFHDVTVKQNFR